MCFPYTIPLVFRPLVQSVGIVCELFQPVSPPGVSTDGLF